MRINTKIDTNSNIYSVIIKEHLAKEITDPNTILLALFQTFIDRSQTKSFLYRNIHKHAAFCRSCLTDEKKSEQKKPELKNTDHKKIEKKMAEEKSASAKAKQPLRPKCDNIAATIDAINTYCKDKVIDSNDEFATMLSTFFSVYSGYNLEKSLKGQLSLLDNLEIIFDVPQLEAQLSHMRRLRLGNKESLSQAINLLFRLMSTQQKQAWVAAQLRDLRVKDDYIRSMACSSLYDNRDIIPSNCWPKIVDCLMDCIADERFQGARLIAFKLIVSPGDAASCAPKQLWFWFYIIREMGKNWDQNLVQIVSQHINQIPADAVSTILDSVVKQLTSKTPYHWGNFEVLLKHCLPLFSKAQWENEIIPCMLRYPFCSGAIDGSHNLFVEKIVPHIPKDLPLWPKLIEKYFGMKDKILIFAPKFIKNFAQHIPDKYWNEIIKFLLSIFQKEYIGDPFLLFGACAPYIPAAEWSLIINTLKSHFAREKLARQWIKESKENKDSKEKGNKACEINQTIGSEDYTGSAPEFLGAGLVVMPDQFKSEVIQLLLDKYKSLHWCIRQWIYELLILAAPHLSKNLITKVINTLLPSLVYEIKEYGTLATIDVLDEYIKAYVTHEQNIEFWSELLTGLFEILKHYKGDFVTSSVLYNFSKVFGCCASHFPKDLWPKIINNLVTLSKSQNEGDVIAARDTMQKNIGHMPESARLDVFKILITQAYTHSGQIFDVINHLGQFIANLPEVLRPEFINALLLELHNEQARVVIVGIFMECRAEIPAPILGDVVRSLLKFGSNHQILDFLMPPIAERVPLDIRPLIVDTLTKILQPEDKSQQSHGNELSAVVILTHYPDLISDSLWPSIIRIMLEAVDKYSLDIVFEVVKSFVRCHAHLSDKDWVRLFMSPGILRASKECQQKDSVLAIFKELALHMPYEHWIDFIKSICVIPRQTPNDYQWDELKMSGADNPLIICIPHIPKALRYEICLHLLAHIQAYNYSIENPVVEAFQKLVPTLECHEYIHIMSNLANKIIQFNKEGPVGATMINLLQILAGINEQVGTKHALGAIFPDNVDKLMLGYLA